METQILTINHSHFSVNCLLPGFLRGYLKGLGVWTREENGNSAARRRSIAQKGLGKGGTCKFEC